jgi:hypothetical protein
MNCGDIIFLKKNEIILLKKYNNNNIFYRSHFGSRLTILILN